MNWKPATIEEIRDPERPWFTVNMKDLLTGREFCHINSVMMGPPILHEQIPKDIAEYIVECVNECKQRQSDENWRRECKETRLPEQRDQHASHFSDVVDYRNESMKLTEGTCDK